MGSRDKVYEIFIDYFGEDYVDLQGGNIMVYFPKVTVTNEYGMSIDIQKLFVKVPIDSEGAAIGIFKLNRSEYTECQFLSGYMHSHVPSINYGSISDFATPCLGSGPIKGTLASLSVEYSEELWRLFCYELDKYVRVESVSGVPYRRLENVGTVNSSAEIYYNNFPSSDAKGVTTSSAREIADQFIPYLVRSNVINYSFLDGSYAVADSYYNIAVKISNVFIDWYNGLTRQEKESIFNNTDVHTITLKVIIKDERMYRRTLNGSYESPQLYQGIKICTFKGKDITLNITDSEDNEEIISTLLYPSFINYIIHILLKTINFKYEQPNKHYGQSVFFTEINKDARVI